VVFILSFRSQNKATKEAAYQKVLDDYTAASLMLIEKPELVKFQIELARTMAPGSPVASRSLEEMTVRNYLMLLYGLFERAYMLYWKNWIDKETWSQWSTFLEAIARHPLFEEAHRSSTGMFDKPFQDYVTDVLKNRRRDHET